MCPCPQEGLEEEGLCCSLLRCVQDDGHTEQLRGVLRGFSHRYRNLLSGVKMGLYFAKKGAAPPVSGKCAELEQIYQIMEQLLDRLQTIYRPMVLTPVRASFMSLVNDRRQIWNDWFHAVGAELEIVAPPAEATVEFDPMHLASALDAFLSWRASTSTPGQGVRLSWRPIEDDFEISWRESEREPDGAGDASLAANHGARCASRTVQALALPLLARVMSAHGGAMEWASEGRFQVHLRWPLRQDKECE
jgi:enamine deaminase RidA (YjgF/YER057c/UK114 family)